MNERLKDLPSRGRRRASHVIERMHQSESWYAKFTTRRCCGSIVYVLSRTLGYLQRAIRISKFVLYARSVPDLAGPDRWQKIGEIGLKSSSRSKCNYRTIVRSLGFKIQTFIFRPRLGVKTPNWVGWLLFQPSLSCSEFVFNLLTDRQFDFSVAAAIGSELGASSSDWIRFWPRESSKVLLFFLTRDRVWLGVLSPVFVEHHPLRLRTSRPEELDRHIRSSEWLDSRCRASTMSYRIQQLRSDCSPSEGRVIAPSSRPLASRTVPTVWGWDGPRSNITSPAGCHHPPSDHTPRHPVYIRPTQPRPTGVKYRRVSLLCLIVCLMRCIVYTLRIVYV